MQSVDVESPQLNKALTKSGLSNPELVEIRDAFKPLYARAEEVVRGAEKIVVTAEDQKEEMKAARAARLELKAVRVEAEKQRKALKESALRRGQVIDEVGRLIKGFVEPVEDRLLAMEEFAERAEAERKAQLSMERERKVLDAGGDPKYYQLGDMPESEFDTLLAGLHKARKDAKEAAEKAEAERLARIKAEQEERARLQAERDKAVAEAEKARQAQEAAAKKAAAERKAIEDKARAEREAAEVAARKEREAREKVEAELAAKRRAEEQAAAEAEKARKAAERAPDAEKFRATARLIREIKVPSMASKEAAELAEKLAHSLESLADWAWDAASELTE